tara:strand:+ start:337 stop:1005 length:669 start_codon:yes stop_codon:yes gene_type:complete
VPVYNEEATIIDLLNKVNAQTHESFDLEIIVVNDGSTDNSLELLETNSNLYSHLVTLPKNKGKGGAVKAGLKKATGKYVLFQDADLEYDPEDYKLLLHPIREFDADVVMGSRMIAPNYTRVHYFWHKIGNNLITLIFNLLYNTTFTDVYSCYLLYRKDLINPDSLRTLGWEQHAEILAKSTKNAKVIYEVPINYHGRGYDEGKKIKAYHIIAVLWTMLRERF